MKKLSLLFVALCAGMSMFAATATLKYAGTTTGNMEGDGKNNAALVGLDENVFTVLSDKGSASNEIGVNKDGSLRLYANRPDGNGSLLTVKVNGTINSIKVDYKQVGTNEVKAGDAVVTGTDGAYTIGNAQFSIKNIQTEGTSNVQVQINSIEIDYTAEGATPEPEKPAFGVKVDSITTAQATGITGTVNRGGFILDGSDILIVNGTDGKLYKYNQSDLKANGQTDSIFATAYYMDKDAAGNYVFFKWLAGGNGVQPVVYNPTTKEIKEHELYQTSANVNNRIDMPTVAGNMLQGKGSIFVAPNGVTYFSRLNFVDGVLQSTDTFDLGIAGTGINYISVIDDDNIIIQKRSVQILKYNLKDNTKTVLFDGLNNCATHGGQYFKVGDKEFYALGDYITGKYLGAFQIWDITDPENIVSVYANANNLGASALGTSVNTFRVIVEGNKATIFQYGAGATLAKYVLTVKKNVLGLTVADAEVELGATVELKATINPEDADNKDLTWETSDATIATVDAKGVVTGLAVGEVTITATSVDDPTVKATAKVTVKDAAPKTIAEVLAGKLAKFTLGEVTVVYAAADYLYVQDATGIIPVYQKGGNFQENYANGDVVKGIEGGYAEYNNNAQITNATVPAKEATAGTAVEPALITEAPTAADMNKYVKVEGATISAKGSRLYIYDGNVQLYDNYKLGIIPTEGYEEKTYTITGFVTLYKETIEISVVTLAETEETGVENVTVELDKNAPMYNVLGVQVDENFKGIVIQNGKKFMLK